MLIFTTDLSDTSSPLRPAAGLAERGFEVQNFGRKRNVDA